jgi:hypothetical protein
MSNQRRSAAGSIVTVVALCAVAMTWARAGAEPTTSAPTTAPGETPKAALLAYNAAMRAGDADGIVALHHATSDAERRVARAIADSEVEVGKLLAAARAKFGDAGAASVGRAIGDVSDADIQAATEQVNGDRAVLRFKHGGAAPLVRADGEWKSSVADVIRAGGGAAQQSIDHFTRRGSFARGLAQDIVAGRVKTADDAVARIERHDRGVSEDDPSN